jgi:hypothetical protein
MKVEEIAKLPPDQLARFRRCASCNDGHSLSLPATTKVTLPIAYPRHAAETAKSTKRPLHYATTLDR